MRGKSALEIHRLRIEQSFPEPISDKLADEIK